MDLPFLQVSFRVEVSPFFFGKMALHSHLHYLDRLLLDKILSLKGSRYKFFLKQKVTETKYFRYVHC